MSRRAGRNAKVVLGIGTAGQTVVGMGNWTLDGYNVDLIDVTAFGDDDKAFDLGFGDAGTLTFNGNFDPDDSVGQQLLESYGRNKVYLTSLFLFIDSVSCYAPDITNDATYAYALVTKSRSIVMDATNVGKISFTAKLSGHWVLV
jgi:hypothetical protein